MPVRRFVAAAVFWTLALFALLRAPWVETHLLTPLACLQGDVAARGLSGPLRVAVTLECSGADLIALCAGVLLAFPMPWRRKLTAAGGALVLLLALNTLRIMALARVADAPALFRILHLYVLPLALQLASAGYVLGWMWWTTRPEPRTSTRGLPRAPLVRSGLGALVLLALYAAVTPELYDSALVAAFARGVTAAAAFLLRLFGVSAEASGPMLRLDTGGFLVTAECVLTPLLPIVLGAVLAMPGRSGRRLLAAAVAVPFFAAMSVARLLVLALPVRLVGSPLFVAHGFRQLAAAALAVAAFSGVGVSTARTRSALVRALAAGGAGLLAALLLAPLWERALLFAAGLVRLAAPHVLTRLAEPGDVQGALALLPGYQLGLLLALLLARAVPGRSMALAFGTLLASQLGLLVGMGEWAAHTGRALDVLAVRGLALAVPVLAALVLARPPRGGSYAGFWQGVGADFPDLAGAASTAFYRENEIRLLTEHLPDLEGRLVLKTDLWDEAKNTRILQWMSGRGARAFGVDISEPTLRQAGAAFAPGGLAAACGDVRALPYRDASFDAIYSMGTIEHFPESAAAVAEMFRVLKPGGRAIIGVPNRYDPFLRPLLVRVLRALDLYAYGAERSFSRRGLRRMLEGAGFRVIAEPAILFIPGWLRMLDLWAYTRCRPLARVTALGVRVFVRLDRHVPAVRRHGYLLATIVTRP